MERKHRAQNLRDRAGVQLDGVRNTPVPENLPLCTRQVSRCTQRVCLLRLFAGFECPRVAWHNDSHQVTNWNKLHKPRLRLTATITWRQRNSRETLCVPNNSHAVVVVTQQEAWAALGSCWESSFDISSIRQRLQEPGAAALGSGAALTFHSSREAKSVPRLVKCPPRLLYGTARLKDWGYFICHCGKGRRCADYLTNLWASRCMMLRCCRLMILIIIYHIHMFLITSSQERATVAP